MSQKFISWTARTRGIDIGCKGTYVSADVTSMKKEGKSILMISGRTAESDWR